MSYKKEISDLLANPTIKSAINFGGVVYGGAVRDTVAGDVFNDIDLYFFDKDKYINFLDRKTKCNNNSIDKITESRFKIPSFNDEQLKYEAVAGVGFEITTCESIYGDSCDVLLSEKTSFHSYHLMDMDINRLYLDNEGFHTYKTNYANHHVYKNGVYSVEEIISNIKKKEFAPEVRGRSPHLGKRKKKMISRGWKENTLLTIRNIIL